MSRSDRIDVYLVAGGKYHNIDYARLELLKLMAEQPRRWRRATRMSCIVSQPD